MAISMQSSVRMECMLWTPTLLTHRKLSGNFIRTQIILNHGEQALKDKQKYQELKEDIADIVYSAELITGGEVLLMNV